MQWKELEVWETMEDIVVEKKAAREKWTVVVDRK